MAALLLMVVVHFGANHYILKCEMKRGTNALRRSVFFVEGMLSSY